MGWFPAQLRFINPVFAWMLNISVTADLITLLELSDVSVFVWFELKEHLNLHLISWDKILRVQLQFNRAHVIFHTRRTNLNKHTLKQRKRKSFSCFSFSLNCPHGAPVVQFLVRVKLLVAVNKQRALTFKNNPSHIISVVFLELCNLWLLLRERTDRNEYRSFRELKSVGLQRLL